jgi:hypothetical protein
MEACGNNIIYLENILQSGVHRYGKLLCYGATTDNSNATKFNKILKKAWSDY